MAGPDFIMDTILKLGQRVGYVCSNPDCLVRTVGPNEIQTKSTLIGEAAHIRGANPGSDKSLPSARYDPDMTDEQRSHISNGIWLCNVCHKIIDSDPDKYPVDRLVKWKADAEARAAAELASA